MSFLDNKFTSRDFVESSKEDGGLRKKLIFKSDKENQDLISILTVVKNGEKYPMKDIPLNSILLNGSRVCSVMQISNLDNNGNFIEKMYKVKRTIKKEKDSDDNANDDSILVSGSHLVYDTTINQFIHVKDLLSAEISDINCPVLYCLITTDHTIQIGEWIFHDWEDSNGSAPKKIGGSRG